MQSATVEGTTTILASSAAHATAGSSRLAATGASVRGRTTTRTSRVRRLGGAGGPISQRSGPQGSLRCGFPPVVATSAAEVPEATTSAAAAVGTGIIGAAETEVEIEVAVTEVAATGVAASGTGTVGTEMAGTGTVGTAIGAVVTEAGATGAVGTEAAGSGTKAIGTETVEVVVPWRTKTTGKEMVGTTTEAVASGTGMLGTETFGVATGVPTGVVLTGVATDGATATETTAAPWTVVASSVRRGPSAAVVVAAGVATGASAIATGS